MSVPALAQAGGPADMADGEVRKVDKDEAKVTLRHGEIRSLDMPPMTMVFTAKDKALLDKVKAGDKVKFKAANEGGKLIVTDIDVAQ
nr:copper-binding protein [Azohydromonas lata]